MKNKDFCSDGCVIVECGLQGDPDIIGYEPDDPYDRQNIYDNHSLNFENYNCFKSTIIGGEYGHPNYAVASYCVVKNHLKCLKYLHKNTELMWHNGLASIACREGNLECLKYIVEEMGDVQITENDLEQSTSDICKKYIKMNNLVNKQIQKQT